mmetsp:Transcript_29992/g.69796  ORF Transcript_29992/g.69796 Transcript_29992/m.69796 type:complete len:405 (-) Transcript_29992:154-1368(-)
MAMQAPMIAPQVAGAINAPHWLHAMGGRGCPAAAAGCNQSGGNAFGSRPAASALGATAVAAFVGMIRLNRGDTAASPFSSARRRCTVPQRQAKKSSSVASEPKTTEKSTSSRKANGAKGSGKRRESLKKVKAKLESKVKMVEDLLEKGDTDVEPDKLFADLQQDAQTSNPRYQDIRKRDQLRRTRAIPFLPEPAYRKFVPNAPGDAGFDPAGLCKDPASFEQYREAEIKHGRLAMIAAIGWPLAEIFSGELSEQFRVPDVLADSGGKLLLTELGGVNEQFVEVLLGAILVVGAAAEVFRPSDRVKPGDLGLSWGGFDTWEGPPGLANLLPPNRGWMPEAELKHGRIAMLAIFTDIAVELATGNPVVEDSEYLFHRIDSKIFRPEYWLSQPEELIDPTILELEVI